MITVKTLMFEPMWFTQTLKNTTPYLIPLLISAGVAMIFRLLLNLFDRRWRKIDFSERPIPPADLMRRCRLLVVDDEYPELVDELKALGYSVDYEKDIDKNNINKLHKNLYSAVILDYRGVGKEFGNDHGLSLLRHLKRVVPATVIIAYTSKPVTSKNSDFFRIADFVLNKDDGIQESTEKIETALRRAVSIENLWGAFLGSLNVSKGSEEDFRLQNLYVRGLESAADREKMKLSVLDILSSPEAREATVSLLSNMFEIGIATYIGK